MKAKGWKMRIVALMAGLVLLVPALSLAQEFPTKSVNILVVFSLGLNHGHFSPNASEHG